MWGQFEPIAPILTIILEHKVGFELIPIIPYSFNERGTLNIKFH